MEEEKDIPQEEQLSNESPKITEPVVEEQEIKEVVEEIIIPEKILNKEEIINAFQDLLKTEDIDNRDLIRTWKNRFFELTKEEEVAQRKSFDAMEDREEDDRFEFQKNALDHRFIELLNIQKTKISEAKAKKVEEEKQNLKIKEGLVESLKKLVEEDMQNVGAAFNSFYEIRDKWNETGQVNKSKFKQLQYDYSHYLDLFYYNVGIHHQLKNYDFQKNAEQKRAIISELKEAAELTSIRQMEKAVKELQAKWDSIGPTSNEIWEMLKNDYWDLVNGVYEKIRIHYKALRETQAKILEEKNALIGNIQELKDGITDYKTPKQWISLSKEVDELHKKWKEAGFLGKSKEDQIWSIFKEVSDELRVKKNAFFDALKKNNSAVVDAKNSLIEKAEALKDSKEWKATTEELIQLQKQWKSAGQGQYKLDQQLWEKFRGACDAFFTSKKEYFDTLDDRQEANFKSKQDLSSKIEKATSGKELRELIEAWQQVDYVPKKKISASEETFNKAVAKAGKTLKLDENEINHLSFEAKVAAIKGDDNAEQKLKSEKVFVRNQIDKIKEEMLRFEENMAFFGPSKGAQKLKEIVEKRIEEANRKLQEWEQKLKMLR